MQMRMLGVLALLVATGMAGCLSDDEDGQPVGTGGTTSVFERADLAFNMTSDVHSWVLEAGPYGIVTPGTQFFAEAELPATEGAEAAMGPVPVSIGVHFPDIPGCDWTASEQPTECQVPVIADVGPYYRSSTGQPALQGDNPAGLGEGDAVVTEYTCNRLMCTLVDNFVPHGYAVVAVSVLGTGDSGSCQDLMGSAEQAGVQAAVEYLGTQAWSNGNVGLIGRSYDGSTPWEAAMVESPHLKTIVPISGLTNGQYDLMWRNGSAEYRGAGLLYALYAQMTIDGEADDLAQVACPDYIVGGPEGGLAYALGSNPQDAGYDYWQERAYFDDVLANYDGSIYFIHGMQDWNVDPTQAFPYYNTLVDAGFEMKGLFGQWDHAYPDRAAERPRLPSGYGEEADAENVRYDWAQDLLEWFDHYLKGTGAKPALHVEIQDNMGAWRIEEAYPPRDSTPVAFGFDEATKLHTTPDVLAGGCDPAGFSSFVPDCQETSNVLRYEFPALSETEDTRLVGNVLLRPTVTPSGPGGQIGATLYDAETGLRLGHAIMDLRYHAGGSDMQSVAPGMAIVPQMEFLPLDVVLPAGHGLLLELTPSVMDYLPSTTTSPIAIDTTAASSITFATVQRDPSVFFKTPQPPADDGADA